MLKNDFIQQTIKFEIIKENPSVINVLFRSHPNYFVDYDIFIIDSFDNLPLYTRLPLLLEDSFDIKQIKHSLKEQKLKYKQILNNEPNHLKFLINQFSIHFKINSTIPFINEEVILSIILDLLKQDINPKNSLFKLQSLNLLEIYTLHEENKKTNFFKQLF